MVTLFAELVHHNGAVHATRDEYGYLFIVHV